MNRDAGHHGHYIAHVGFSDGHSLILGLFFPGPLGLFELVVEDSLFVAQARRFLVPLGADNLALVLLDLLDFLLNLDNLSGTWMLVKCTRHPPHPRRQWPCRAGADP